MKTTSLVFCLVLALGSCVNTGRRTTGKRPEIAYGTLVDYPSIKRSYPFIARLNLDGFRCGGALITDRLIATAKHCLVRCPCYSDGSDDWTTCPECFVKLRENSDTNVDVETVYSIKKGHFLQDEEADFALIEIAKSANTCTVEEEDKKLCWEVTPVGLPDQALDIPDLATVRTLGWGATEDSVYSDADQSEFLRRLDVTINSTSDPLLIMTNVGFNNADPCGGDSGGPLLFGRPRTLVATLRGGGYDCETNNRTDGISDWNKVSTHLPWIRSIIGNMPDQTPPPPPTSPTPPATSAPAGPSQDLLYLGSKTVELPSFSPLPGCTAPPHPVQRLRYAVTALVQGKVITCGGVGADNNKLSSCHSLHGGEWSPAPSMREKRSAAATSLTTQGMLVSGGYNYDDDDLSSTEYYAGGQWVRGPEMPVEMNSHCQVTVGETVIVTGGYNGDGGWLSSVFQLKNNIWTSLPGMKERRSGHSCTLYREEVVVMGGYGDGAFLASTEILNLSSLEWRRGPALPSTVDDGLSTVYQDTLYLVNRYDGKVMSLSGDGTDQWKVIDNLGSLGKARQVFPPPIVSRDIIGC